MTWRKKKKGNRREKEKLEYQDKGKKEALNEKESKKEQTHVAENHETANVKLNNHLVVVVVVVVSVIGGGAVVGNPQSFSAVRQIFLKPKALQLK